MISEFTLFVFTLLGGISAGAYFVSALFPEGGERNPRAWLFPLVCLVLLGAGLLCVLFHLQQPMRFLNALANPTSGITLEAYFSMPFCLVLLIDCALELFKKKSVRWLKIIGAVLALGLMFVMSYMYVVSANVPAWHSWETIPFYVVLDLALGAAFYPLFIAKPNRPEAYAITNAALQAFAAVIAALEGAHFASVGLSAIPFIAGAVMMAVSAVFAFRMKGSWTRSMAVVICVLTVVGVAVARYAYYAASIL